MIPPTIADEYPIRLSTGETIQIAEIDAFRSPALANLHVLKVLDGLLKHCSSMSRKIVEEAKGGYDTNFKALLRAQPMGCMIKSNSPICLRINDCSMASKPVCTLHNCLPSKTPLPICWEFSPPPIANLEVRLAAIELGTIVGHAWRRGLYVCLVF
jgi:hypothetical protein